MQEFDVYGVGNALVDTEFEVDESYLQKMSVAKGLMTLVDQSRQDELLSHLDGIQHKRSCGGSAANSVIAVSQLGGNSYYSCKVANDETGDFYYSDLKAAGVMSSFGEARDEGVTGRCFVFITPDADRTMNTYLGITETLSTAQIRKEAVEKSKMVYLEGYLVTSPTGREAAIETRKIAESNGVKTCITFSDPGIVEHFKDGLKQMIGEKVDYIFCNEAEAMSFSGEPDIHKSIEMLKTVSKNMAITRGAKGAIIFDGNKSYEVPTRQVEPVDTNGAGDLFAGSYMFGVANGFSAEKSAHLACAAASTLVTQFGARLKKDQMSEILASLD